VQLIPDTKFYVPDNCQEFTRPNKRTRRAAGLNYQADRIKAAYKRCKRRRVALDVGAHVGLITNQLAGIFDTVIAVEPNPTNYECLQVNTKNLLGVSLWRLALGEAEGTIDLATNPKNSGDSRIVRGGSTTPMRRLDDMQLPGVDFIKLDVQGYEAHVLRGGEETIKRYRPVCIIEHEDGMGKAYGLDDDAADDLIRGWGANLVEIIGVDRIYAFD
jgi:FkbM family methyltransferase